MTYMEHFPPPSRINFSGLEKAIAILATQAYLYDAPCFKVTAGRKHVSMLVLAAGTQNARLAFPEEIYVPVTFVINSFLRYFSSGVCPFVVRK